MKIAKIINSNSHIDYVGRVVDSLDVANPPEPEDFGFANFVSVPIENNAEIIGVIYNSILVNPEYANFGPRLSPKPELGNFSPDYLNEQGVLVGILLLGTRDENGGISQGVPHTVVPAGQEVYKIDGERVKDFHTDESDAVQIHYYSQVVAHAGLLAVPLLEEIINKLSLDCSAEDKNRLGVLKQTLTWQRTIGGMRL